MICETCKSEMVFFEEGLSCGWKCPKCGNSLITTNSNNILLDETIYKISISPSIAAIDDLKIISKICNIPILEAKKLAAKGGVIIEDKASRIKPAFDLISTSALTFDISPDFPYKS